MNGKIALPRPVMTVLRKLEISGFSAYAVGGCVRDSLRGVTPHDFDCATSAKPEETLRCFEGFRVIPTGIRHGTVTVVLEGMPIEITTFRVDGAYSDHRRPDTVMFTDSVKADLSRRDFTVNAMAYHPERGLIDPFGGERDLKAGVIACVGDARQRFEEDGLRILRALRFASALGFTIERETADAVLSQRELLAQISKERVFSELKKLLCGQGVQEILLDYSEVLFTILPALRPMKGFAQRCVYHDTDVYTHTCGVIAGVPQTPPQRLAALFHDSGKPYTLTRDEKGDHFYGHAELSAEIAREQLKILRADRKTIEEVCTLVRYHDVHHKGGEKALKRLMKRVGAERAREILVFQRADDAAKSEAVREELLRTDDLARKTLEEILKRGDCVTLSQLAVGGKDLLEAGFTRGGAIGECLDALLEGVIAGELENERGALLGAAQQFLKSRGQA